MYGGSSGVASTMYSGTTSLAATYNETPTTIKTALDNWYFDNISGKSFESNVVNNLFCNDRQTYGPGYGNTGTVTYYAAYQRLLSQKNPSLKCAQKNDRFTTSSDTTRGNGALAYPVGLITADEASLAGLVQGMGNDTNYLYTNQIYWTFSPYQMNSSGYAIVSYINSTGSLYSNNVTGVNGVRPSVSISSEIRVIGEGSLTNPFKPIE